MSQQLKHVAEAIENVMLEDVASHKISSYHIELIPDDNKVVIHYVKLQAVKKVEVSFSITQGK